MSKKRRNFTARFKADLVLEVLKGEKELNVIATENNIQPNLLRNWKKEFENMRQLSLTPARTTGWKRNFRKRKKQKKSMLRRSAS